MCDNDEDLDNLLDDALEDLCATETAAKEKLQQQDEALAEKLASEQFASQLQGGGAGVPPDLAALLGQMNDLSTMMRAEGGGGDIGRPEASPGTNPGSPDELQALMGNIFTALNAAGMGSGDAGSGDEADSLNKLKRTLADTINALRADGTTTEEERAELARCEAMVKSLDAVNDTFKAEGASGGTTSAGNTGVNIGDNSTKSSVGNGNNDNDVNTHDEIKQLQDAQNNLEKVMAMFAAMQQMDSTSSARQDGSKIQSGEHHKKGETAAPAGSSAAGCQGDGGDQTAAAEDELAQIAELVLLAPFQQMHALYPEFLDKARRESERRKQHINAAGNSEIDAQATKELQKYTQDDTELKRFEEQYVVMTKICETLQAIQQKGKDGEKKAQDDDGKGRASQANNDQPTTPQGFIELVEHLHTLGKPPAELAQAITESAQTAVDVASS